MNMLPIYLTDICCVALATAFSFLMNALPHANITPEFMDLHRDVWRWIFWRVYGIVL